MPPSLPSSPQARHQDLLQLFQAGQAAALAALAQARIDSYPTDAYPWQALAGAHWLQGEPARALPALQEAARRAPGSADVQCNLGDTWYALGDTPAAITAWETALRLTPDHPASNQQLARLAVARGNPGQGSKLLQAALRGRLARPDLGNTHAGAPDQLPVEHATALLWSTLAGLAASGLHASCHAGTLLGIEREGKLLAGDKDLDLALPLQELPAAARHLLDHGWKALVADDLPYSNPYSLIHSEYGVVLDLFGMQPEADGRSCITGIWLAGLRREEQRVCRFPPFALSLRPHPAGKLWHLEHPDAWLRAIYGDWQQADPDFVTLIDAHNLEGFSVLTEYLAYRLLNEQLQRGLHAAARRLCRRLLHKTPAQPLLLALQQRLAEADCA